MKGRTSFQHLPGPAYPSQLRTLTVQGHQAIPLPSALLPPPASCLGGARNGLARSGWEKGEESQARGEVEQRHRPPSCLQTGGPKGTCAGEQRRGEDVGLPLYLRLHLPANELRPRMAQDCLSPERSSRPSGIFTGAHRHTKSSSDEFQRDRGR